LYLQGDISEKQGEGEASPHHRFVEGTANLFESADDEDYGHFEEVIRPTMPLNLAVENESEGEASDKGKRMTQGEKLAVLLATLAE
jgi:hypothetical protein